MNLDQAFERIEDEWSPRIVATLNDYDVKLAKLDGEFVWHAHDHTDELFLVLAGRLRIELENDEDVVLGPGGLHVVPKGIRHRPIADPGTQIMLIEPRGTVNTGDADADGTAGTPLVGPAE